MEKELILCKNKTKILTNLIHGKNEVALDGWKTSNLNSKLLHGLWHEQ